MRLRVRPEINNPRSTAAARRKIEAELELADGQSFIVTGLSSAADWPSLAKRMFAVPAEKTRRAGIVGPGHGAMPRPITQWPGLADGKYDFATIADHIHHYVLDRIDRRCPRLDPAAAAAPYSKFLQASPIP